MARRPVRLKVVTLNLANDLLYWTDRAPLILAELGRLAPDVVTLQEVSLPFNNARWLADRLDGYQVLLCAGTGYRENREASAILTRLPVIEHGRLQLAEQHRVVQRAIVQVDDQPWEVANAHLHWSLRDDEVRAGQVRRLVDWLRGDLPTVLCGDFNAKPGWRAVNAAREHFTSAHAVTHGGHEPDYTFPTPLWRAVPLGPIGRRVVTRLVLPAFTHRRAPWRTTLDYIFVDERVEVEACEVAFDVPVPGRPWVYPSDHLGLAAVLRARAGPAQLVKADPGAA
jgi:endonuclease/exonuclease/phosphatase family metal-dependent hydrolase